MSDKVYCIIAHGYKQYQIGLKKRDKNPYNKTRKELVHRVIIVLDDTQTKKL